MTCVCSTHGINDKLKRFFSIYDFQRVNIIRKIHVTVEWSCYNTARHSGHLFRDEQRKTENLTIHEQFANYSQLWKLLTVQSPDSLLHVVVKQALANYSQV